MTMFSIFKKTNDKKAHYKFRDPENTACIICEHVFNTEGPILYVTHDSTDGCWQFMCGLEYHDESKAKVISLKQATEIDSSINDLYEMPLGVGAERKTSTDKWIPFKLPDEK